MHNSKLEQIKINNWLKRNSIRKNEDYIIKLLNHYGITDYQFTINPFGDEDIIICSYMNKKYKIQINEEEFAYNLLEFNLANNHGYKEKYHILDKFYGNDSALIDIFKYIKNKSDKALKVSSCN